MSCATVRDGIEVGTRFFDLTFAFSRAALEYAGDEVRFCLDDRHVPAHLRGFLLERDVSGILAHWGALWGQPSEVRRIEVAESLGERVAPVLRDRGFRVETTASTHAVVVDARALDRPMPTASPEAAAVLLRECAELLQRRQNHGEFGAACGKCCCVALPRVPRRTRWPRSWGRACVPCGGSWGRRGPRTGRSWPRR